MNSPATFLHNLKLPPKTGSEHIPHLPHTRSVTIVGANGAGKTLFKEDLKLRCGDKAFSLSALNGMFPDNSESVKNSSIDRLYSETIKSRPYLKDSAISEIDKLAFLLFTDELEYLLSVKAEKTEGQTQVELKPTKLDKLGSIWKRLFPGSRIMKQSGELMFANRSGDTPVEPHRLSRGEKTVLYYIAGALYAMPNAVIFIDSPSLFLHKAILNPLWNAIEELRPDCAFVYDTNDMDFVNTRLRNACVWIRSYDADEKSWDYEILQAGHISEDLLTDIVGSRKPMLFIEGDAIHSIDAKLYARVFPDYTVRPLGSCDKVIEATRTFNDLKYMHQLDSHGIVDRDRRTPQEVEYLRKKNILVPEVAEVENIFLLEGIIRNMATKRGKNADRIFQQTKHEIINLFSKQYESQALMHVRHRMKREVECKIDAKFSCITALEAHVNSLIKLLTPRENYNHLITEFKTMIETEDYNGILRVFNNKAILADSGIAERLGYSNKEAYIAGVLASMKDNDKYARNLRATVRHCFLLPADRIPETLQPEDKKPSDTASNEIKQKNKKKRWYNNHKKDEPLPLNPDI